MKFLPFDQSDKFSLTPRGLAYAAGEPSEQRVQKELSEAQKSVELFSKFDLKEGEKKYDEGVKKAEKEISEVKLLADSFNPRNGELDSKLEKLEAQLSRLKDGFQAFMKRKMQGVTTLVSNEVNVKLSENTERPKKIESTEKLASTAQKLLDQAKIAFPGVLAAHAPDRPYEIFVSNKKIEIKLYAQGADDKATPTDTLSFKIENKRYVFKLDGPGGRKDWEISDAVLATRGIGELIKKQLKRPYDQKVLEDIKEAASNEPLVEVEGGAATFEKNELLIEEKMRLGKEAFDKENFKGAQGYFKEAIDIATKNPDETKRLASSRYNYARCIMKLGDNKSAIIEFGKAADQARKNKDDHLEYQSLAMQANCYYNLKDYKSVLAILDDATMKKLAVLNPTSVLAFETMVNESKRLLGVKPENITQGPTVEETGAEGRNEWNEAVEKLNKANRFVQEKRDATPFFEQAYSKFLEAAQKAKGTEAIMKNEKRYYQSMYRAVQCQYFSHGFEIILEQNLVPNESAIKAAKEIVDTMDGAIKKFRQYEDKSQQANIGIMFRHALDVLELAEKEEKRITAQKAADVKVQEQEAAREAARAAAAKEAAQKAAAAEQEEMKKLQDEANRFIDAVEAELNKMIEDYIKKPEKANWDVADRTLVDQFKTKITQKFSSEYGSNKNMTAFANKRKTDIADFVARPAEAKRFARAIFKPIDTEMKAAFQGTVDQISQWTTEQGRKDLQQHLEAVSAKLLQDADEKLGSYPASVQTDAQKQAYREKITSLSSSLSSLGKRYATDLKMQFNEVVNDPTLAVGQKEFLDEPKGPPIVAKIVMRLEERVAKKVAAQQQPEQLEPQVKPPVPPKAPEQPAPPSPPKTAEAKPSDSSGKLSESLIYEQIKAYYKEMNEFHSKVRALQDQNSGFYKFYLKSPAALQKYLEELDKKMMEFQNRNITELILKSEIQPYAQESTPEKKNSWARAMYKSHIQYEVDKPYMEKYAQEMIKKYSPYIDDFSQYQIKKIADLRAIHSDEEAQKHGLYGLDAVNALIQAHQRKLELVPQLRLALHAPFFIPESTQINIGDSELLTFQQLLGTDKEVPKSQPAPKPPEPPKPLEPSPKPPEVIPVPPKPPESVPAIEALKDTNAKLKDELKATQDNLAALNKRMAEITAKLDGQAQDVASLRKELKDKQVESVQATALLRDIYIGKMKEYVARWNEIVGDGKRDNKEFTKAQWEADIQSAAGGDVKFLGLSYLQTWLPFVNAQTAKKAAVLPKPPESVPPAPPRPADTVTPVPPEARPVDQKLPEKAADTKEVEAFKSQVNAASREFSIVCDELDEFDEMKFEDITKRKEKDPNFDISQEVKSRNDKIRTFNILFETKLLPEARKLKLDVQEQYILLRMANMKLRLGNLKDAIELMSKVNAMPDTTEKQSQRVQKYIRNTWDVIHEQQGKEE